MQRFTSRSHFFESDDEKGINRLCFTSEMGVPSTRVQTDSGTHDMGTMSTMYPYHFSFSHFSMLDSLMLS